MKIKKKPGPKPGSKYRHKTLPTNRRAWGPQVRRNELGDLLKAERTKRQIPQHTVAAALQKATGGTATNVRVSSAELGKSLPHDPELAVYSKLYGLALPTLKAKRDELKKERDAETSQNRRTANKKRWTERAKPGPKPRAQLNGGAQPAPLLAAPAGTPEIADLVNLIDGVVPMPADKEARKRWFACAMELFKLGTTGGPQ